MILEHTIQLPRGTMFAVTIQDVWGGSGGSLGP